MWINMNLRPDDPSSPPGIMVQWLGKSSQNGLNMDPKKSDLWIVTWLTQTISDHLKPQMWTTNLSRFFFVATDINPNINR